jgi:hypothetical protein
MNCTDKFDLRLKLRRVNELEGYFSLACPIACMNFFIDAWSLGWPLILNSVQLKFNDCKLRKSSEEAAENVYVNFDLSRSIWSIFCW